MPRLTQRSHARKKSLCYPDDLLPQIQSTLAALADVECYYDILQERLATDRAGPALEDEQRRLQRRRNDEREPLYEKLAQLRERALKAAAAQNRRLAG